MRLQLHPRVHATKVHGTRDDHHGQERVAEARVVSALIAKTNKWLQPNITVKMVPNFLDLTDGDRAVQKVGTEKCDSRNQAPMVATQSVPCPTPMRPTVAHAPLAPQP